MESAFVNSGVETMLSELPEYFMDMFLVKLNVVRVDEDVIEIDDNTNIKHIGKDVVHEPLECCWGVGKSKRHDLPFK
jgi:hypothetical protein